MQDRTPGGPPPKRDQRRGSRFSVVVPVQVKWQQPDGSALTETVQAKEVSLQGGLLEMKASPSIGSEIELMNLTTGEAARVRVVGSRRPRGSETPGVAVELLTSSETFWGVNFQLKKTSFELVKLEQAMKAGSVDRRILIEFRDAVDYVGKTAWAVQEWQERELQKHDPQTLLPLITTERIRRATQLSKAIIADLAAHEVTRETTGISDFFRAVEGLYTRISDLFRGQA